MKRFALVVLVILVLIAFDRLWITYRYTKPFHRIGRGSTQAQVLAAFGKPQYVSEMRDTVKESFDRGDEFTIAGTEIVKSYCYWPPLGIGGHFCFGFDADGQVISKGKPPKL